MAPRTTYATLADGLQPFSLWDQSLADMGLLGTIPCSATGTNAITLTPLTASFAPNITAYTNYLQFSFVATATSSGAITAQIGSLGLKNVYLDDGITQATTGNVTLGGLYIVVYSSALNSSAGGFYLQSSAGVTANSVNTAAIQNNAVTFAKFQQMAGLSVVGVTGSTTSNVGAITGTANQFLGVNSAGNALAFETMSGDATLASGTLTVAANVITYSKLAATVQGLTNTRLAKVALYTVVNGNKGDTIALAGNAQYTLTFNAASTYDPNFSVVVINEDTGRGKTIACNGLTNFILWPGQTCTVYNDNNVWRVVKPNRWILTGNLTLFVNPTGSDSNDGLLTGAANAFLTGQAAYDTISQQIDLASFSATISLDAGSGGSYSPASGTTFISMLGPLVGTARRGTQGAALAITGAGAGSTTLSMTLANAFACDQGQSVTVSNMTIILGGGVGNQGNALICDNGGIAAVNGLTVGGTGNHVLQANQNSQMQVNGALSISGAFSTIFSANADSAILCDSQTITFSGATTVTATMECTSQSYMELRGNTYTNPGNVTGARFNLANDGYIRTDSGNTTDLPGTTAGAIDASSHYNNFNSNQIPGSITNDVPNVGTIGELITSQALGSSSTATVTITIASPGVITWTAHPFSNTAPHSDVAPVVFTTSGALPTGITSGTTYWTIPSTITTNTFQIATSAANAIAGTSVNTSGSQSGTQTATAGAPLVSTTPLAVTAVPLTAGDWDVWAFYCFNGNAATTVNYNWGTMSTTAASMSNTIPGSFYFRREAGLTLYDQGAASTGISGPIRVSIASTTNFFLNTQSLFATNTSLVFGSLFARRRR